MHLFVYSVVTDFLNSKVPPLTNLLRKDSLIAFLCQDILLQNRKCLPWYKKNFVLHTAVKIVKKMFLKYALLHEDLMV